MFGRALLLLLLVLAVSACGGSRPPPASSGPALVAMSTALVDAHGTRAFRGTPDAVTEAVIAALRNLGYRIALVQGTSQVKTEPMASGTTPLASTNAYGELTYSTSTFTRTYSVTLTETANGIVVRAAPHMAQDGRDVSGGAVWQLEGQSGEDAQWTRLFDEIAKSLAMVPPR